MSHGIMVGVGLLACVSTGAFAATKHSHFKIMAHKAEVIVLKQFPHGKITEKTKQEDEEGTWQYGVMVLDGKTLHEVMVNAKTGHIDNDEVTNAVKERDEVKADAAAAQKGNSEAPEQGEKGEQAESGESN
jgi:hypothetical protein